jgi:hypothetical protein
MVLYERGIYPREALTRTATSAMKIFYVPLTYRQQVNSVRQVYLS